MGIRGGGVESGAENGGKGGYEQGVETQFCLPSLVEEDYLEHH